MIIKIKEIVEEYLQDIAKFQRFELYLDSWDEVGKEFFKLIGVESSLDVRFSGTSQERLFSEVHLDTWLCTDTTVGLKLIVETDSPESVLAVTWQPARKSSEDFYWVSEGAIDRAHYLMTLYTIFDNPVEKAKKDLVDSFEI